MALRGYTEFQLEALAIVNRITEPTDPKLVKKRSD